MVARLGGDEFVIVIPSEDDAQALAERILAAVEEPVFAVSGARVGASIGIAQGIVASAGSELLRRADGAMYAAKAAGKGTIRWAA